MIGGMTMKKVSVAEIESYSWHCPECGTHNINDKDTNLICSNCHEQFEVGDIS